MADVWTLLIVAFFGLCVALCAAATHHRARRREDLAPSSPEARREPWA